MSTRPRRRAMDLKQLDSNQRSSPGRRELLLALACLILAASICGVLQSAQIVRDDLYETKLHAAALMKQSMDAVKKYKQERGIALDFSVDYHETGMLGDSFTGITTTLGSPEAKRTSAHPDMAALAVELLRQAGVRSGDRVGATFSGSFPALNLAVLAACEALEAECVYIASVGSSTYGANQPELTFPDMTLLLAEDNLIKGSCLAVTPGGNADTGGGMEPEVLEPILARLRSRGLKVEAQSVFDQNLAWRRALLERDGTISCFVNVGGAITSMGKGDSAFYLGQGLLSGPQYLTGADSGLIEIYHSMGVPVINLLNLRMLTAEYGLEYDPINPAKAGESAVYYKNAYNRALALLPIPFLTALLLWYGKLGRLERQEQLARLFEGM